MSSILFFSRHPLTDAQIKTLNSIGYKEIKTAFFNLERDRVVEQIEEINSSFQIKLKHIGGVFPPFAYRELLNAGYCILQAEGCPETRKQGLFKLVGFYSDYLGLCNKVKEGFPDKQPVIKSYFVPSVVPLEEQEGVKFF